MQLDRIFTILDKPKHEQAALKRLQGLSAPAPNRKRKPSHVAASFCWHPLGEARKTLGAEDAKQLKKNLMGSREEWLAELLDSERYPQIKGRVVWTPQLAEWVIDNLSPDRFDLIIKTVLKQRHLKLTDSDWRLVNASPIPVLLTAQPSVKRRRHVVAAVDLLDLDRKHQALNFQVLSAAASLAMASGCELHVACAVEFSEVLRDLDLIEPRAVREKLIKKSRPLLKTLCAPFEIPDERMHFPLGKAGYALNSVCKSVKAHTIVVGSFPHPEKAWLGLGNTATRIIGKSNVDVLVVPA
ncbi:MAG: universal stress protein [Pseudomonadota bacterium]